MKFTELKYNLINSALAGLLVLFGSFATVEEITFKGVFLAIMAALVIAIQKFKDWFKTQNPNPQKLKILSFV